MSKYLPHVRPCLKSNLLLFFTIQSLGQGQNVIAFGLFFWPIFLKSIIIWVFLKATVFRNIFSKLVISFFHFFFFRSNFSKYFLKVRSFFKTSFIHSFSHTVTHSLTHPCTHSPNHSFTHSLSHSFTHSFIHSLIHSCVADRKFCVGHCNISQAEHKWY